jgi:hypothetical protein
MQANERGGSKIRRQQKSVGLSQYIPIRIIGVGRNSPKNNTAVMISLNIPLFLAQHHGFSNLGNKNSHAFLL